VKIEKRVLDSWPVMGWLLEDSSSVRERVHRLLYAAEKGEAQLFMSAINVGEVYYALLKRAQPAIASRWREISGTLPVTIEVPALDDIWQAAALKGQFPLAYSDAFAAALAQKHRCPLVTGDPEFRSVANLELEWLGPATESRRQLKR
jgi:uncharacterized protein